MKAILYILCFISVGAMAQSKKVTESVKVTNEEKLHLEFTFADKITFETWDKNEVLVEVDVEINEGKYNDIFTLSSSKSGSTIYIEMDKDMWKKAKREDDCNNWNTNIDYKVYLPKGMELQASTISGDYEFIYFDSPVYLKTISGAIDMTIKSNQGMDFRAKTISGEIFSDIDIQYPEGKAGLKQIVGQKIKGRISRGGKESEFETISGHIFLRKR